MQDQNEKSNLSPSAKICMRYLPSATSACKNSGVTDMANKVMDPATPTTEADLINCCIAIETVKKVKLEEQDQANSNEGRTVVINYFDKLHKQVKDSGYGIINKVAA